MTVIMKKPNIYLDDYKRQMIVENIHLVKMISSKIAIFLPRHIDTEDLIHEGLMGLMDAAIKFDPNMGMKFSTYATIRIKGAILDCLRSMDWIPRRVRKISKNIDKVREELQQSLLREPTLEEISDYMKISPVTLQKIISDIDQSHMISFEDLQTFTSRYFVPEGQVTSATSFRPNLDYERIELKAQLKDAISDLNEREKLILSLYYIEDLTLKEIKEILNISEARISQIHTSCLKKLRSKIEGGNEQISNKKAGSKIA